jgi:peptide-methionine (S)-S-oxide reductase
MRSKKSWLVVLGLGLGVGLVAAAVGGRKDSVPKKPAVREPDVVPAVTARATFGAGCFWCTEAVFSPLRGVLSVVSGYSGGSVANPTYRQVCTGTTGHAEVVQVTYDPAVISYEDLLEVFWQTHDPTTSDRQGPDWGSQYRSVIFYHSDGQRRLAEQYKAKLDAAGAFADPVVTQIVPFTAFYPAEAYHQNFYAEHASQPYCKALIRPKVEKVKKVFHDKLKGESGG